MPSFYQHIAFAAAAVFFVLLVVAQHYAPPFLAFFIASVFPDIDSRNSTVRKTVSLVIPAALSFFVVLSVNADLSARILSGFAALFASRAAIDALPLSHRGKKSLHNKQFLFVFSVAIGFSVWWFSGRTNLPALIAAAALGYAVHMAADRLFGKS